MGEDDEEEYANDVKIYEPKQRQAARRDDSDHREDLNMKDLSSPANGGA